MPKRAPTYRPPIPKRTRAAPERAHSRARGYDRTWERLRKMHLNNNPWCARCKALGVIKVATVADHVIPIAVDPDRRLDPSNLQSLCKTHHDRDKQREDRAAARARARPA